jgi:hypothetical protein
VSSNLTHAVLPKVLRGEGFGLVKFRQPNDADQIVYLDTWVRDLSPNTSYLLRHGHLAVDGPEPQRHAVSELRIHRK